MIGRGVSPTNWAPLLNFIFKNNFLFLTEHNPSFTLFLICSYFFTQSQLRFSYEVCSYKKRECITVFVIMRSIAEALFLFTQDGLFTIGIILNWNMRLKKKFFFFLSGFSFTDTDDSQDSRGREGTIFYSTLPLPPAHEHSNI